MHPWDIHYVRKPPRLILESMMMLCEKVKQKWTKLEFNGYKFAHADSIAHKLTLLSFNGQKWHKTQVDTREDESTQLDTTWPNLTQFDKTLQNLSKHETTWKTWQITWCHLTQLNTSWWNLTQLNLRSYAQILCSFIKFGRYRWIFIYAGMNQRTSFL